MVKLVNQLLLNNGWLYLAILRVSLCPLLGWWGEWIHVTQRKRGGLRPPTQRLPGSRFGHGDQPSKLNLESFICFIHIFEGISPFGLFSLTTKESRNNNPDKKRWGCLFCGGKRGFFWWRPWIPMTGTLVATWFDVRSKRRCRLRGRGGIGPVGLGIRVLGFLKVVWKLMCCIYIYSSM